MHLLLIGELDVAAVDELRARFWELRRAGLHVREESSFQGGDGYLLFGTTELALASVARVAEHALGDEKPHARGDCAGERRENVEAGCDAARDRQEAKEPAQQHEQRIPGRVRQAERVSPTRIHTSLTSSHATIA